MYIIKHMYIISDTALMFYSLCLYHWYSTDVLFISVYIGVYRSMHVTDSTNLVGSIDHELLMSFRKYIYSEAAQVY